MRFKLRFGAEDAAERRYTGLITGVSDMDPVRWPCSKWRCLSVRWDDQDARRLNRVSPWEIEPSGSVCGSRSLVVPGAKRTRVGLPSTKQDLPVPRDGTGLSDFGESLRFQKVLQGQEIMGFFTPKNGVGPQNQHRSVPGSNGSRTSATGNGVKNPIGNSDISNKSMGFSESFRFNEVLQGQEIFSSSPYGRGITSGVQAPSSGNGYSGLMHCYNTCVHPPAPSIHASSPSSVLMFQQASTPSPKFDAVCGVNNQVERRITFDVSEKYYGKLTRENPQDMNCFFLSKEHDQLGIPHPGLATRSSFSGSQDLASACKRSCRLFGFQLTEGRHTINNVDNPSQFTSPYGPDTSFNPHGDGYLHSNAPAVTKLVGSNCTKVTDLYAVRDVLLDIAL